MNKQTLLEALKEGRENMEEILEGISETEMTEPGVSGEWSVKDILAHLTYWEAELIKLLWQAQQGQKPSTVQFQEESVDEVNARWYEDIKKRQLDRVLADFDSVRKQTIRRVENLSEKDLTDPQRFSWLGERPLWQWIAIDSYEHEAEHGEDIQHWLEQKDTEA
jgi:hypothetical protein